jgi:WD40 repeat protein
LGTEGGAVYACGDGFQYLRPWLTTDPNQVISISAPSNNSILVAFEDNSLAVLDLPNLNILDLLPGNTWLNSKQCGDITFIHVDEPADKPFVFVGTSRGYIFVLEVKDSIRVCEYMLTPSDLGLAPSCNMVVAEIAVCPKDEKYIAVGLSSADRALGKVVVFNFVKHKIKTTHDTLSISSVCWDHTGETLYAGACCR